MGYLAVILDLFSRSVVGWAIDTSLSTQLPLAALAQRNHVLRRPVEPEQYTSFGYQATLRISVSMSRKGNCWDNAVAESFFSTLKTELIHRRTWRDAFDVREAVFEYIEIFSNRRRLRSSLGYRSPAAVEEELARAA